MAETRPGRSGSPVALITGVTGQDGIYLALLLQSRGYHVVGTTRQSNHPLHLYLRDVDLVLHDIRDGRQFAELLDRYEPDEIYNLAAFSSVGASWHQAELVGETNGMAVLRMLDSLLRIFRDRTAAGQRGSTRPRRRRCSGWRSTSRRTRSPRTTRAAPTPPRRASPST